MKLSLICVGRLSLTYLRDGVKDYGGRLQRYLPLRMLELKEEKAARVEPAYLRERESRRILEKVPDGAWVIALDEHGRSFTSEGVAELLGKHMLQSTAELVFIIGGAYGLNDAVRQRANLLWSLSSLTLTHQMARLLLLEQLYRGLTILRNEPYHNR